MNVKITAIRSIAMGDQMLSNYYYYFKSQKKELFWRSERKLLRLSTSEVHDRTKERDKKSSLCGWEYNGDWYFKCFHDHWNFFWMFQWILKNYFEGLSTILKISQEHVMGWLIEKWILRMKKIHSIISCLTGIWDFFV